MRRGLAPLHPETGSSMELHHIYGRETVNANHISNLRKVWPCEYDVIDKFRHYTGPVPSDWTGEMPF